MHPNVTVTNIGVDTKRRWVGGISKDKTITGQRAGSPGPTVTRKASEGTKGCGVNENCGRLLECGVCWLNLDTVNNSLQKR